MKLFEMAKFDEYPEDSNQIWTEMSHYGTPLFTRDKLEELWREFSEEEYCAGYLCYSEDYVIQFIYWLKEKENES